MESFLNGIWYGSSPIRWLLWPLTPVYGLLRKLDRWRAKPKRIAVPVVVVGNLTVGGTGKTPIVQWLSKALSDRGCRVGLISRGFSAAGSRKGTLVEVDSDVEDVGDEALMLRRTTGLPTAVCKRRVRAGELLLESHDLDVVIADDGLQHWGLIRDFEICVIDGERGLGNGLCLPAGPLREPEDRLNDVHAVIVNGGSYRPPVDHYRFALEISPVAMSLGGGEPSVLDRFRDSRVHALAGIGNPDRFFDALENAGLTVIRHPFPDHHDYSHRDLEFAETAPVLMTEKDAVKCERFNIKNGWVVSAEVRIDRGDALIEKVLAQAGLG